MATARRAIRDDGCAGRIVRNASRANYADVTDLLPQFAQMAAAAGRDLGTLPITIFGARVNLDRVRRYRDRGIARVVATLPSAPSAEILPMLDLWAEMIHHAAG